MDNTIPPPAGKKQNECGDCNLCCKVMGISELNKPPGPWCSHAVKGKGCGIYEQRPGSCRQFGCFWLLGNLAPEYKPNKVKAVIAIPPGEDHVRVYLDAGCSNWDAGPLGRLLRRIQRDKPVFIRHFNGTISVLKPESMDPAVVSQMLGKFLNIPNPQINDLGAGKSEDNAHGSLGFPGKDGSEKAK